MAVCRDLYGYALSCSPEASTAYNRGVGDLLRLRAGAERSVAASVVLDPTFALGHATLALLGHELCAAVDVPARMRDAIAHSHAATARERDHIAAVAAHLRGD